MPVVQDRTQSSHKLTSIGIELPSRATADHRVRTPPQYNFFTIPRSFVTIEHNTAPTHQIIHAKDAPETSEWIPAKNRNKRASSAAAC